MLIMFKIMIRYYYYRKLPSHIKGTLIDIIWREVAVRLVQYVWVKARNYQGNFTLERLIPAVSKVEFNVVLLILDYARLFLNCCSQDNES